MEEYGQNDAFNVYHTPETHKHTKKRSPRVQGRQIPLRFVQLPSKKLCAHAH